MRRRRAHFLNGVALHIFERSFVCRYHANVNSQRWRFTLADRLLAVALGPEIATNRMILRPLRATDFPAWQEVRVRCAEWLVPWEPKRPEGTTDPVENRRVFDARCEARDRERASGASYAFGMFLDGRFIGECNLNNVQRGAMQSAYVGYWIDQRMAGLGLMPEAVVGLFRYAFEVIGLHRLQVSIVPRNARSRRVAEKLELRNEGIALRYLEINGVWEDHVRYGFTSEEWLERRSELVGRWLESAPQNPTPEALQNEGPDS